MSELLTALSPVLVIEGLMPLISPARWREVFAGILALGDGQIRFIGLANVGMGLLGLLWAR